jgi:hypothetical protein
MTTLDKAFADASTVASIYAKYLGLPIFGELVKVAGSMKLAPKAKPKAEKKGAKPGPKKAPKAKKAAVKAKAAPKKTASKPGRKGEWPARVGAVLAEIPGASPKAVIDALGFTGNTSKSNHVRTVLSSMKKRGQATNTDGQWFISKEFRQQSAQA